MATRATTIMTKKTTRLPNNLGQFFRSAHVANVIADKSKEGLLSHRLATVAHTYGVPVQQICVLAKINKNIASHVLHGVFDHTPHSVPAARLAQVLTTLEKTLPLLDEKHYRPRTWAEAIALCMQHA